MKRPEKQNGLKSLILEYKLDIVVFTSLLVIAFIMSSNYSVLYVNGSSMNPTYQDEDVLILNKEKNHLNGNVVVFNSPEDWSSESKKFIKRILASEGDSVTITNETLLVNNKSVANISEKNCGLESAEEFNIPEDKYLMVGDNYSASNDSITQFCSGNENFLIDEKSIILSGKHFKVIGGILN